MKTVTLYCLLSWIPSILLAQSTAPVPIDISYHFPQGKVIHLHRVDEFRNPDRPMGYAGGNWDWNQDIQIVVEKVDLDGSATLVVKDSETQSVPWSSSSTKLADGQTLTTHMEGDIPMYWVTVDKYGNYLKGGIIRRTTRDSIVHEEMKRPDFVGSVAPDSSRIKHSLYEFLIPKGSPTRSSKGAHWSDSICERRNPVILPLSHSPSSPQVVSSPAPSYRSRRYDYTISKADAKFATMDLEVTNYQVGEGQLMSQAFDQGSETIRMSDGLPMTLTEEGRRIGGLGMDRSYWKRTVKLVGIDAVAK